MAVGYRQSSLTTDSIPYPVTFESNGVVTDPTAYTAEFAFMLDEQTKPGTNDWHAGTWQTWTITGPGTPYRAVTPSVGPTGTITTLTARPQPYYPWLRITVAANDVHVVQLPPLYIT